MASFTNELEKPQISAIEVMDIAIGLLLEGRSMSECRSYIVDEYNVDATELELLLVRAQQQVRVCEIEMYRQLRF